MRPGSLHSGEGTTAASASMPLASRRFADGLRKLALAVAPLRWAALRVSRLVAEAPPDSFLHPLLGPAYGRLREGASAEDLLGLVNAIRLQGIDVWLSGGWGVDALVGRQTRHHRDVDVVVDDFDVQAPRAAAILGSFGFETVTRFRQDAWMPDSWQMRDRSLRSVGLSSIDWSRLCNAFGETDSTGFADTLPALRQFVFTEGTVAGRPVPCLTAEVQLLYHTGFALNGAQRDDVKLLKALIANGQSREG